MPQTKYTLEKIIRLSAKGIVAIAISLSGCKDTNCLDGQNFKLLKGCVDYECWSDYDCEGKTPRCSKGECVECKYNTDCKTDERCYATDCTKNPDCLGDWVCKSNEGFKGICIDTGINKGCYSVRENSDWNSSRQKFKRRSWKIDEPK